MGAETTNRTVTGKARQRHKARIMGITNEPTASNQRIRRRGKEGASAGAGRWGKQQVGAAAYKALTAAGIQRHTIRHKALVERRRGVKARGRLLSVSSKGKQG